MPTKNFCYCIGGTGARVAEVAAHLCAANMISQDQPIEFIIVDKDSKCKGTENATATIASISKLSSRKPDAILIRSNSEDNGMHSERNFCKVDLRKNNWSFTNAMANLSNRNVNELTISQTLCSDAEDHCILDALYSDEEQNQNTDRGFYGHPSIGALIFNFMVKKANWRPEDGAGDIAQSVNDHLATPGNVARVFIIGSIFGGTGASVFSNLAKYLRKTAKNKGTSNRLAISGCLLLPYFDFPQSEETDNSLKVDANDFYIKSKVALEQYGMDRSLVRDAANPDYVFESLYVLGQRPLHRTSEIHANGGEEQCNHFDIVDLLAADAMIDFFNSDLEDKDSNIYEFRLSNNMNDKGDLLSPIDFIMLPNLSNPIKSMLVFSSFIVSVIYADMLFTAKNTLTRALDAPKLFASSSRKNAFYNEINNEVKPVVEAVYNYCSKFIRFAFDISKTGAAWDGGTVNVENDFQLLDSHYLANLKTVCDEIDLASNGAANITPQRQTTILNTANDIHGKLAFNGCTITPDKVSDYLSGMCNNGSFWSNINCDNRNKAADYIHEAYRYISQNVV